MAERRAVRPLTPYHARYYAMLLTRRDGGVERYLPALATAAIDLHPHQIDAAVFASRSVYRDGVILADEEGLGKTIEAGIALLQASLEGCRRLLVLCPPALTDHWRDELAGKFSLPVIALDDADSADHDGEDAKVVVATYGEAYRQAERVAAIPWDLAVLDEAHQLANAGLSDHVQANVIREALKGRRKLLLTATPMQNSIMDLYHLVRFVDETTFAADPEAFRVRYVGPAKHRAELAERAQAICYRTLRRHAATMPATRRVVRTLLVEPSEAETSFSKRMSLYFHRDPLLAFPKVQEHKIRLTYWKLLASSPRALREALERLIARLDHVPGAWDEQQELRGLVADLDAIDPGTPAAAFLDALADTFGQLHKAGIPRKAVIFSESRATLAFLDDLLSANGYAGRIVTHQPGAAGKKALTAFAGDGADILLATDAAGVGVDLAHCALVVNWDMPWNVQKLEQRISRCHRYGQQHDVTVLNFLDPTNRADRRLFDSLNQKLKRFDQLFGASETVLGRAGQDADAAPRPADQVRAERETAREARRKETEREEKRSEADLLSHFDDEVRARFKRYGEAIPKALSRMEGWLWELTKYRLGQRAAFSDADRSFVLDRSPYPGLRLSGIVFGMDKTRSLAERYRLNHPLARRLLADCLDGGLERGRFTLKARGAFMPGMTGEIGLWLAGMVTEAAAETHPILCGVAEDGRAISAEDCAELLKLPVMACEGGPVATEAGDVYRGRVWRDGGASAAREPLVDGALAKERDRVLETAQRAFIAARDGELTAELERLRQWAKDEEHALSLRQEELWRKIKALKEKAAATTAFVERFQLNQQAVELEKERGAAKERIFHLSAEIRQRRDALMDAAREKTTARFWERELFVCRFEITDGRKG